uniref:DEAD/SNF2-like helicase n=1 Tax=Marseillevirus LCMAC101 TaxID=2506602 RepID=A0A481YS33_9VIRU|nr:MAG: DEAD/SNF2-like helicase [Marseillevirus LCMAC101]
MADDVTIIPKRDWRGKRVKKMKGVSPEYQCLVFNHDLSKKKMIEADLTDALRAASKNGYARRSLDKYLGLRPLPLKSKFSLYPHQEKCLTWLKEREDSIHYGIKGGIVALEMGLGKTIVAMAHALISPRPPCKERHGEKGFPTLVVCSKTVMQNWKLEKEKFFGHRVNVLFFHSMYMGKAVNHVTREYIVEHDLVVTTYDVLRTICTKEAYHEAVLERGDDTSMQKGKVIAINCRRRWQSNHHSTVGKGILYCTPWERVIADESHKFANPTTATYKYIMALYGKYKICLSGTPVLNRECDIWSQMRFCGYTGVDRALDWKKKWEEKMKRQQLHTTILEMTYKDAGIELPDLHHYKMEIKLKDEEKECYDFVMGKTKNVYFSMTQELTNFANVLVLFLRCRQCCVAPYLMTYESKRTKGGSLGRAQANKNKQEVKLMKELYKGGLGTWLHDKRGTAGMRSAKIQAIVKKLKNLNGKVLVYSTFTSALDLLADACDDYLPDFKYIQVDGGTVGEERQRSFARFRKSKRIRGLFLTYKVGSEGITLTEATHVIPMEPWWNDAVPNQAIHRAWRLGQKNDVEVHNILIEDSIEDKMRTICEGKDEMSKAILAGSTHKITRMDKYTLGRLLGIYK